MNVNVNEQDFEDMTFDLDADVIRVISRANRDFDDILRMLSNNRIQRNLVTNLEFEADALCGGVRLHTKDAVMYQHNARMAHAAGHPAEVDLWIALARSQVTAAQGCADGLKVLRAGVSLATESVRPVA